MQTVAHSAVPHRWKKIPSSLEFLISLPDSLIERAQFDVFGEIHIPVPEGKMGDLFDVEPEDVAEALRTRKDGDQITIGAIDLVYCSNVYFQAE